MWVSIHAPAWGATYSAIFSIVDSGVSIHAPAWGATQWKKLQGRFPTGFNPRTRVGCDRTMECRFMHPPCFNPRTRVGCDAPNWTPLNIWVLFQSTHPRGVRPPGGQRDGRDLRVSIHAPAWGATILLARKKPLTSGFNPRTRVGCDSPSTRRMPTPTSFNPRTRVGCDFRNCLAWMVKAKFQSTHPRGVRHDDIKPTDRGLVLFQSTHPRGVRPRA